MTQAERLIAAIRRRPMTYGEILDLHISTSFWRRLSESGHKYLKPGERIERKAGRDGLLRLRVVR
jgi:hypothetical protein